MTAKAKAFLAAYRETGSITKAAVAAKCTRDAHYAWYETARGYAAAFAEAKMRAVAALEDEAIRRANEGVLEAVYYKGEPVGAVRRYSDGLLMFLLRGMAPEKYARQSSVEVTGPGGGPIEIVERLNAARKRLAAAK